MSSIHRQQANWISLFTLVGSPSAHALSRSAQSIRFLWRLLVCAYVCMFICSSCFRTIPAAKIRHAIAHNKRTYISIAFYSFLKSFICSAATNKRCARCTDVASLAMDLYTDSAERTIIIMKNEKKKLSSREKRDISYCYSNRSAWVLFTIDFFSQCTWETKS